MVQVHREYPAQSVFDRPDLGFQRIKIRMPHRHDPESTGITNRPHQFGLDRASHGRKNDGMAHTHKITQAISDALSVSCFDQCEHAWVFIRRNAICMAKRKKAPENRGLFLFRTIRSAPSPALR